MTSPVIPEWPLVIPHLDGGTGTVYRYTASLPAGADPAGDRTGADSDAVPYPERESLPAGSCRRPPATPNLHVLRTGAGPHRLQVLKARAGRAALPATAPTLPPPDRTCRRGDGGGEDACRTPHHARIRPPPAPIACAQGGDAPCPALWGRGEVEEGGGGRNGGGPRR